MATAEKNKQYIGKHDRKANERLFDITAERLENFCNQHFETIRKYLKTGVVEYKDIETISSWKAKFEKYKELSAKK